MTSLTSELTSAMCAKSSVSAARPVVVAPDEGVLHRILVATDGSSAAEGALRLADLIAQRGEIPVEVLSVLDPAPRVTERLVADALVEQVERRFARIRGQVGAVIGARSTWRTAIDMGPVSETICRVAHARASDLIVVGFGQHRRLRDRTPDEATVRRIAELSSTPVLVVPSHTHVLPTRVMLALDFSRSSIRAARAALRVMGTPGVVHLVYVHTNYEPFPGEPVDPDPTYAAGFASFFEAVELELCPPPGVSFERAVVQGGDPVSELLAYASANEVELIAVGNHGKATHERLHLGSVSAAIVRSAQCAVLVSGSSHRGPGEGLSTMQTTAGTFRGER